MTSEAMVMIDTLLDVIKYSRLRTKSKNCVPLLMSMVVTALLLICSVMFSADQEVLLVWCGHSTGDLPAASFSYSSPISLFNTVQRWRGAEHNQLTMNFPSSWISEGLGKTWNLPLTTCVCVREGWRYDHGSLGHHKSSVTLIKKFKKINPSGRATELARGWRRVEGVGCPSFKSLAARSAVPDIRTMGATEPGGGGGLQRGRSPGAEILRKQACIQEKWGVSITLYHKGKKPWFNMVWLATLNVSLYHCKICIV